MRVPLSRWAWLGIALALAVVAGTVGFVVFKPLSGHRGGTAGVAASHVMPDPARRTAVAVEYAKAGVRQGQGQGQGHGPAAPPVRAAPFAQRPAVGADQSRGTLIQLTDAGPVLLADLSQGPYDGSAATLTGVVNDSGQPVRALTISADAGVFAFGGRGLCGAGYRAAALQARCRPGRDGFPGPGTAFSAIGKDGRQGTVEFAHPLTPGATAYFALAQAVAANGPGGGPSAAQVGETNTAVHDSAGNLLTTTDALGATTTYEHGDPSHPGDVTSVTTTARRTTDYAYDDQGDPVSTTVHPTTDEDDTTGAGYNADGELICETSARAEAAGTHCPGPGDEPDPATTRFVHSSTPAGPRTSVTDPTGHVTTTREDLAGNVTATTDADGSTTCFRYDRDNRQTRVIRPAAPPRHPRRRPRTSPTAACTRRPTPPGTARRTPMTRCPARSR